MPRGNAKKKGKQPSKVSSPRRGGGNVELPGSGNGVTSDSDDISETTSIFSGCTDNRSIPEETSDGEMDSDQQVVTQDDFENKLKDCIELATQKSAGGRTKAMQNLAVAFTKRMCTDFLAERKITIADILERNLKKGKGEEQSVAARCAAILVIQLGLTSDAEEVFTELRTTLMTVFQNAATDPKARAQCAICLGVCTFVAGQEIEDIQQVLSILESNFSASYLKGNMAPPTHDTPITAMHAASLQAWSLLLCICPPHMADELINKHITKLSGVLQSNDVELRIAAGEVIALCYEIQRDMDEDFAGDDIEELCQQLKQLATDSVKYRAKKERRHQRSIFRDIYGAIKDYESPSIQRKFGTECLMIETWARKRQYDCFCQCLTTGMNLHLRENLLLRDIFGLGAVLCSTDIKARMKSRADRHSWNSAAFKERTKIRGKARDKRMATLSF